MPALAGGLSHARTGICLLFDTRVESPTACAVCTMSHSDRSGRRV